MFYIKERHNPQLGVYYVGCGKMTKREAKAKESPIYGNNRMLSFPTLEAYEAELDRLKKSGELIRHR